MSVLVLGGWGCSPQPEAPPSVTSQPSLKHEQPKKLPVLPQNDPSLWGEDPEGQGAALPSLELPDHSFIESPNEVAPVEDGGEALASTPPDPHFIDGD